MRKEINIFLTAVMFYTRIPCPAGIDHSGDMLNKATRYFPIIGWIVGGAVALVYWLTTFIMPLPISVLFSMAFGIMLTGAFHEDGFADVCDGFGGGYTKEARLNIMKDSRIGTYGTVGLLLLLLTKFYLLTHLSVLALTLILIVAHSVSRFVPVLVIFSGEYAREDLTSKVKPIGRKISSGEFIFALITALLPILLLQNYLYFTVVFIPIISGLLLMQYFKKRIGGYTGDCLGTIQQVSEIGVYFSVYILYRYFI